MNKPHPREYGFSDASGIQGAIEEEKKRKTIVAKVGFVFFWLGFLLSTTPVIRAYLLLPHSSLALHQLDERELMVLIFIGFISTGIGIGIGLFFRLGARSIAERLLRPSPDFSKAKQYLNANETWKQYIQHKYGYNS